MPQINLNLKRGLVIDLLVVVWAAVEVASLLEKLK